MSASRKTKESQARTLEALWGRDPGRSARGPKRGLSVEKIASTAIGIADEEGLDGISMQQVAGRLGYTAMSLYRYVPGKEQLVDIVYDRAIGPPPGRAAPGVSADGAGGTADEPGEPGRPDSGAPDGRDWRAGVYHWVRSILKVYDRHPWLLDITMSTPPLGPNQLAWLDALLQEVADIGLEDDEMLFLAMFVGGAVRDLARTSRELAQAPDRTGVTVREMGENYARAMRELMDGSRFPALSRLVASGVFEPGDTAYNDIVPSLDFGLQRLLDGVESRVRSARGAPGA
ncbi:TetR/AcrR family transcriptional regulator [Streptomyces qinzhouensis]|uniref:TetR/AcrR family transcriptional regulator n=1 Tax=Streptomyces qinzhouensis TaxID=2599401 RepID=A0A5B8JI69_9ACTN|nr:TetR/AcrR family transcriptional regulator C-terminal domain-containing protein [Streptomyces qinzhouensis]QDY79541.1 TetR/AcrR family transcriptional regulator [Streptomyces qinzhouensis]